MPERETVVKYDLNEEKVLFQWTAADRAFQRRNRDFWVTAISILVLVAVILFFIKEFFLIIALGSVLFLYYVLSTVEPGTVTNKITNRGIYYGDLRYSWADLERFWFKTSLSTDMVHFGTRLKFPRVVSLVINPKDQNTIRGIVVKRIPLIESSPNTVDKLTVWFGAHLPLEDRNKTPNKV